MTSDFCCTDEQDDEEEYEVSEGLRLQRSKSNVTGYTHVYETSSGKFKAEVREGGKHVNLGSHGTAREAAAAVARHVNPGSRRTARAAASAAPRQYASYVRVKVA